MFARISAVVMLALPLFVAATDSQCNTSNIQCCNSVQSASNPTTQVVQMAALVGAVLGSATGQVGVSCSPLSVVGLNNNACGAQPVCCTNNSFNGVLALGCSPITVGA